MEEQKLAEERVMRGCLYRKHVCSDLICIISDIYEISGLYDWNLRTKPLATQKNVSLSSQKGL